MKLSVIIPVYNTEKYLDRSLQSVLTSTHKDIEVIAVAMRACTFFASPVRLCILCYWKFHRLILFCDLSSYFCQVPADLFHALDLIILHDNVLAPGEVFIIDYFPARAHCEHCMVCLYTDSPVRSADTDEGNCLLFEIFRIQSLAGFFQHLEMCT